MTPKLYDIPISPYAQKVKLALLEKGLAFSAEIPDVDAPDPEFSAVSPRLEVPAYVDDTVRLFDSTIIVEYLEDRWPETPLLPKAAAERARVRTLEDICDTTYDAVNWGICEILYFNRAQGELAQRLLAKAREQINGLNARLERELSDRAWLNGAEFGYGNLAAYPFVNGAAAMGFKPPAGGRVDQWLRTVRARPSALRIKLDVIESMSRFLGRPADVAQGRHRRRFRDHRLEWLVRSGGLEVLQAGMRNNDLRFSEELT